MQRPLAAGVMVEQRTAVLTQHEARAQCACDERLGAADRRLEIVAARQPGRNRGGKGAAGAVRAVARDWRRGEFNEGASVKEQIDQVAPIVAIMTIGAAERMPPLDHDGPCAKAAKYARRRPH